MTTFTVSNICHAFTAANVGTRVLNKGAFMAALEGALESYDRSGDETPGQHFITLPAGAHSLVSCGDGLVPVEEVDPNPFVVREWRGENEEFLKRRYAAKVTGVAVVLYTTEAYLADKDPSLTEEEKQRVQETGASHVVVAVLAFGGPPPRYTLKSGRTIGLTSPTRLEKNMSGANSDYADMTDDEKEEARRVTANRWAEWRTVAD